MKLIFGVVRGGLCCNMLSGANGRFLRPKSEGYGACISVFLGLGAVSCQSGVGGGEVGACSREGGTRRFTLTI